MQARVSGGEESAAGKNRRFLSETNMDEVESEIACRIVNENRRFIAAA